MNMNVQRPQGTELRLLRTNGKLPLAAPSYSVQWKHGLWLLSASMFLYFVASASPTLLLIVLGVFVGLVATAAAICVYALNNSFW